MHYKYRWWDDLFKDLINNHMVNGESFDWNVVGDDDMNLVVKREDYESDTPWPFLCYTFTSKEGEVVYTVMNKREGGGTETLLRSIATPNGIRYLHELHDDNAERILQECYISGVRLISTIWYS